MPAEHVLTPDDKCPCGKPQTGSGYCSYECYSKHEPEPASMGEPLSEAELIEMVGRRSLDEIRIYLAGPPALIGPGHGRDLDRMAWLLDRVDRLEGQLATAREELDSLELIAAPHRMTADQRERYRRHASWEGAEHYLKQAEAAARKWQREADWLREFRDTRKAETEAGTWPPPGDFGCCAEHPAKALGLDGGDPDA